MLSMDKPVKETCSVSKLLFDSRLQLPPYQRPYRWTRTHVAELLGDIAFAINMQRQHNDYRYRIGTIILYRNTGSNGADGNGRAAYNCRLDAEDDVQDTDNYKLDIVDGQQRLITLSLIWLFLNNGENTNNCALLAHEYGNKATKLNIHENYAMIKEWFEGEGSMIEDYLEAFETVLEAVVIEVTELSEAFQLFDSQNSRGRELYPHDLLKAYHLRAMGESSYIMQRAVTTWESYESERVERLFNDYLFAIMNWSRRQATLPFTASRIGVFKGAPRGSNYTYGRRSAHAIPYFQIGDAVVEGEGFFLMVNHYLELMDDMKSELEDLMRKADFSELKSAYEAKDVSKGYKYAIDLFRRALFCYYDRFGKLDAKAVKKIFVWAMALRVDLRVLGFDSVNKYAAGQYSKLYSNTIPMFERIVEARTPIDIAGLSVRLCLDVEGQNEDERQGLKNQLLCILGAKG